MTYSAMPYSTLSHLASASPLDALRSIQEVGLSDITFAQPAWLHAIWIAPVLIAMITWSARESRKRAAAFGTAELRTSLGLETRPRISGGLCVAAASACIAIALARPQLDPQPRDIIATGRDVVVVLDVSRSMLAEDIAPNRLERAKIWIGDLAASLPGDRLSLVAFAGSAVVKCPPTLDHGFFSLALDDLDPRSVTRGGTMIGDALRVVLDQIASDDTGTLDVLLITDGEDQGSFPVQAAQGIADAGGRIIAIGIGSEHGGSPIPDAGRGGFVEAEGKVVRSKLDAATLSDIARATPGGAFLRVGTDAIELDTVFTELTPAPADGEATTSRSVTYTEAYQLFLLAAFALLAIDSLRMKGALR